MYRSPQLLAEKLQQRAVEFCPTFRSCGTWPHCSNTISLAPLMPSRSFSPLANGINSSCRPHITNVGT